MVTVVIDGKTAPVPQGDQPARGCQAAGTEVPYFCYHPGLSSPAVCRQCMVDVKGQPKPVPSCYTPVADKMEVATRSPRALDVRRQMLEFTLVNHPIDCPICDKAGECTLQKHYFDWDAKLARNDGIKVKKDKVVDVGPHIVLDQERCILCTRCIRVCDEVAKTHQLEMAHRGDREVLTTAPGHKLDNPYSLNTVDVCPVGALTAKDFRFAMRAWELSRRRRSARAAPPAATSRSTHSRDQVYRLVPRPNPAVNKYWMCDEGRFTYKRAADAAPGGAAVGRHAGRLGPRARRRGQAAARRARRQPAARSASCSTRSRPTKICYALARLAFDHLRVGRAYMAAAGPGLARRHPGQRRQEPEHGGREGDRRGPAAQPAGSRHDLKAGAVTTLLVVGTHGVLGKKARGGAAAGSAADAGRDWHAPRRRGRGGAASRCRWPRGPRSTARSPTAWAWCSACARRRRRRATPARLGDPVAPGAQAGRDDGVRRGRRRVFPRPGRAAVHERRGLGRGRCCPCSSVSRAREVKR